MPKLRYLTAGESHGEMLCGILEGMPAGMSLIAERDIDPILQERQKGYGRGRRQQIEQDRVRIISGVRFGITTGAPIAILIENKDWAHWQQKMSVTPIESEAKRVTVPRPGHADLAGAIKFGHERDMRNVLERASARETAMRVALGAIANTLLRNLGIDSISYVRSIGKIESYCKDPFESRELISASLVRFADSTAGEKIMKEIDSAKAEGDTLGGVIECIVRGLPVGIGSHTHWDRKLDALIAQAVMSIQAVKAVEIGAGIKAAHVRGSEMHDPMAVEYDSIARGRNNAGGIEGGMSNGEDIIVRASMKPISTLMQPLESVDLETGESTEAHIERSDVCVVPALAVIVENVVALTIASELLDTFGGDTLAELQQRVAARRERMKLSVLTGKV